MEYSTGAERSALIHDNFAGEWDIWIEIKSRDRPHMEASVSRREDFVI